jgi:hypothetical protein
VEEEGEGEARIPIMCRIILIMPLNIDIDKALFTRIIHNTPSFRLVLENLIGPF